MHHPAIDSRAKCASLLPVQWVRHHRQRILLVFTSAAVLAMAYGFLKRIDIDLLAPFRSGPEEVAEPSDSDCQPFDYEGMCAFVRVTPLSSRERGVRRFRAVYRMVDGPGAARIERHIDVPAAEADRVQEILRSQEAVTCRGVYMAGPCETPPFVFDDVLSSN